MPVTERLWGTPITKRKYTDRMTQREKGVLSSKNKFKLSELDKAAKFYGYDGWFDIRLDNEPNITNNITLRLRQNKGKFVIPLTVEEKVFKASQAQVKYTWDSLMKEYPDFDKAFEEYMDNRTQNTEFKRINKLNISAKEKYNMIGVAEGRHGEETKKIRRFNERVYQPFKNTISTARIKASK